MIAWLLAFALAFEPVRLPTPDGASVVLHRSGGSGDPVLLVHGVSSNHYFFEVGASSSLVEHLVAAGYDVWNLDLRGHGEALRDAAGKRQRPDASIDDYGRQDVPTALAHIRAETGAERVHYIGHSMGGMVLAIYLASEGDAALASSVVLASPLDMRDPELIVRLLLGGGKLAGPLRRIPTPMGAKGLALVKRDLPGQLDAMLYNPANVDKAVEARMLRSVVSPLTAGEIKQLTAMAEDPEFRSEDGDRKWRYELGDVVIPMLFVAGRHDHVVTPERVRAYHDAVGSPEKAFVVVSEVNGFSGDYGHLDYCCAREAATELYPMVEHWLDAHPSEER